MKTICICSKSIEHDVLKVLKFKKYGLIVDIYRENISVIDIVNRVMNNFGLLNNIQNV